MVWNFFSNLFFISDMDSSSILFFLSIVMNLPSFESKLTKDTYKGYAYSKSRWSLIFFPTYKHAHFNWSNLNGMEP
jgi:hypothetical protein